MAERKKKVIAVCLGMIAVLFIGVLVVGVVGLAKQMKAITNQLTYLQDTTDIVQNDLGSLQYDIQKTLEEENSMVESYSIDVVYVNFVNEIYQVQVTVIPKEYTDSTKAKIFFGTKEYPLVLQGYTYQGRYTLPIRESFDGNITFLFQNGDKKTTEVLKNYVGFFTGLEEVLAGSSLEGTKYGENTLEIAEELEYVLDGAGKFEFSSLMCVLEANGTVLEEKELLVEELEPEEDTDFFSGIGEESTEATSGEAVTMEPVMGKTGAFELKMKQEIAPDTPVRVYLKAVSTEGYVFFEELFSGTTAETGGFKESQQLLESYVVDSKGGKLLLGQ